MNWRLAATALFTIFLAACETTPSQQGAWLMDGDTPWVGPNGQCMQLRPLTDKDKSGFCYEVMTGVYQKKHHYETLDKEEFQFLYSQLPSIEGNVDKIMQPVKPEAPILAELDIKLKPVETVKQLYTTMPFAFNSAHFSQHNQKLLRTSFATWKQQGMLVVSVSVTGHTDSKGPAAYNLLLSKWRAQSVAYFLKRIGIAPSDIIQGGVGMDMPHPNARSDAENRYVDLKVWLLPTDESNGQRVALLGIWHY